MFSIGIRTVGGEESEAAGLWFCLPFLLLVTNGNGPQPILACYVRKGLKFSYLRCLELHTSLEGENSPSLPADSPFSYYFFLEPLLAWPNYREAN